ncbi:hypothetical protein OEIGOIKO_08064 [Streptomyces chrestomyceticus JCM 4735]|uniref:Uncharacterized protein n=1 Tax=Streptomyces chrestomyceticus JCM 4735 TaxID=1306181 RepID=A0A7U9Q163_9ACTN|nr:hypothetical protein [Streptomyces chrestomyceticus]GCD40207.1 hypothetical protein OEIGOIKO_08064 [Streptomyces chrestomyceticus JCM 4735]
MTDTTAERIEAFIERLRIPFGMEVGLERDWDVLVCLQALDAGGEDRTVRRKNGTTGERKKQEQG